MNTFTERPNAATSRTVIADHLNSCPRGATVSALADHLSMGRSTVGKHLSALEAEGTVYRTPGGRDGKRRLPDVWHATPGAVGAGEADQAGQDTSNDTAEAPHACQGAPTAAAASWPTPAEGSESSLCPQPEVGGDANSSTTPDGRSEGRPSAQPEETSTQHRDGESASAQTSEPATPSYAPEHTGQASNHNGGDHVEAGLQDGAKPQAPSPTAPATDDTTDPAGAGPDTGAPPEPGINRVSGTHRLRPGQLRDLVRQALVESPDTDFSPSELGHRFGRSIGAVQNALATMVKNGEADLTCQAPRRYRAR